MQSTSSKNHTTVHSDRALMAVLEALSSEPLLARDYVLKGGLALRLIYGSPRISDDLDLSSAKPYTADVTDEKNDLLLAFCDLLDGALTSVEAKHGLGDMHVLERTLSTEIPALLGSVAYSDRDRTGRSSAHEEIKMQVTLSEFICESARFQVHGVTVQAAALEDILADKLKAMLQQVTRNKLRPMDVYDLWYFGMESPQPINVDRLREYLEIKAARWQEVFPPTRERFHMHTLREHSEEGFPDLLERLGPDAPRVSFDDAFAGVLALVDRLELPDLAQNGQ